MYERNFRRIEQKYVLTKQQKEHLLFRIKKHLEKDDFYKSTITNIYFDNKNNDLIINSLEKPIYKEKIRLRCYKSNPTLNDDVFFEIKNKYKGIVGKRRIKIKLKEFYNYLNKKELPKDNQIMKEIDYFINYYDLESKIYIAYDRESFRGLGDNDLRITFDSNLRSRIEDINLEYGDAGKKFFKEDIYIMEIKALGTIPLWLVKELSLLKIYPSSFSKYGNIYSKNLKEGLYV